MMKEWLLMPVGPYQAWELAYMLVVLVLGYFLILKRVP